MKSTLLITICTFLTINSIAQTRIYSEDYKIIKTGKYEKMSLKEFNNTNRIYPQRKKGKGFNKFIYLNDKKITLFKSIATDNKISPAGILDETSIVEVDTIYYINTFEDSTDTWNVTFNVWYAININEVKYYIDYKIHDRYLFTENIDFLNQKIALIAESTGYDFTYDIGYPENFFVAIFNLTDELVYISKPLEFNYNDEYWVPELAITDIKNENNLFQFTLNGENKLEVIWNGKELITK